MMMIVIVRRIRKDPRFRDYSMEDYWQKTKNRKSDTICYSVGYFLIIATFFGCAIYNFILCRWYATSGEKTTWFSVWINSVLLDTFLVEPIGVFYSLSILQSGTEDDEAKSGKCRNCCLMTVNQANRDNLY
jgi:hypothetical protein